MWSKLILAIQKLILFLKVVFSHPFHDSKIKYDNKQNKYIIVKNT